MKDETVSVQPSYYTDCNTLPLENFIQAYCNNNLSALLITGVATHDELWGIWEAILYEYSGLIKNDESNYIFKLSKDIALLEYHIIFIEKAVDLLHYRFDEEIITEIKSMGYTINESFDTKEYFDELNMIISLVKTQVFDVGVLQEEYKRLNNTSSGRKQTQEEFNITVAALSKHQGYHINKKETTVLEFCSIFNLYLLELGSIQSNTNTRSKEESLTEHGAWTQDPSLNRQFRK